MIPIFPKLSRLTLEHKKHIEAYTHAFAPYSDFTFISLWTYNTEDQIEVSSLNNNLVIKFTDYITLKPFYSFIGTNEIKHTIDTLLQDAHQKGYEPYLKLVPEISIVSDAALTKHYNIKEDLDNHDYVISARHVVELPENIYKRKKYLIERFKRKYPNYKVEIHDLSKKETHKKLIDVFLQWEKRMHKDRNETENELTAIKRLFESAHLWDVFAITISVDNKIIAFNTYEKAHGKYGISSFQKADKSFTGVYSVLTHEATKHMHSLGCDYINFEQDLGIEGLRLSKSRWKPAHFLKKYIITPKKSV